VGYRPTTVTIYSQFRIMIAVIYLSGRVSGNHEFRETKKGGLWLKLFLEIESVRPDGRGGVKTETSILPISCFSREAEAVKDLRNGAWVLIGVHLAGTEFTSPDGSIKRGVQLTANSVHLPPPRKETP
jgi:single-stranded DNA-binding protein